MRISILWWPGQRGPDLTRGNASALKKLGHHVQVITKEHSSYLNTGADIIFTSMPRLIYQEEPKVPTILQLGGYGNQIILPGQVSTLLPQIIKHAQVTSIIDPKYYHELADSNLDFNWEEIFCIPNGVYTLPLVKPYENDKFTVLNLAGAWRIKNPDEYIEAAKECDLPIKFQFISNSGISYSGELDWLELDNLEFFPRLPHKVAMSLLAGADIITHFSQAEIQPWTIFEAFLWGKPVIANELGLLQTVKEAKIEEMMRDFGMSMELFDIKWEDEYYTGDHYRRATNHEELLSEIEQLYNDQDERNRLGRRGQKWVSHWYTQFDKVKILLRKLVE